MRLILLSAVAAACIAGPTSASSITDEYSSFYNFGDSLSDDGQGKNPAFVLPYVEGRASNGQVWAENIEDAFIAEGQESDNLALSGATAQGADSGEPTFVRLATFAGQIAQFTENLVAGEAPGDNPLVAVWLGGNDLLATIAGPDRVAAAEQAADDVMNGILAIAAIAGQNFDDFIVPNLFDLGRAPAYTVSDPANIANATQATRAFNDRLALNIDLMEQGGLNIIDIDIESLFNELQDNPDVYGYTNVDGFCVDFGDLASRCGQTDPAEADGYLFLDGVHPTRTTHRYISDLVTARLNEELPAAVPLPATLPLILLGMGAIAAAGRRRRSA